MGMACLLCPLCLMYGYKEISKRMLLTMRTYDVDDDDVYDDETHDDATIMIRSRMNVRRLSGRDAWDEKGLGECEKHRHCKNSMPAG